MLRLRSTPALLCGALLVTACSRGVPAPVPTAVAPSGALAGESVEVAISGRHFLPLAVADFGGHQGSTVEERVEVMLGTTVLEGVVLESSTELRGRVPAGLPAGVYDVIVRGAGGEGVLAGAFVMRPQPAAALRFETAPRHVNAGSCSEPITVRLDDAQGRATTPEAALPLTIALSPEGLAQLFSDPACSSSLEAPLLAPGQARLSFHARGSTPGDGDLAVSADALPGDSQPFGIRLGPTARFQWEPIPSPQTTRDSFAVRAASQDAAGNATALNGAVSLTPAQGVGMRCTSGCDASGNALFIDGLFVGGISIDTPVAGLSLTLTDGAASASSNTFDVFGPPAVALVLTTPARTFVAGACAGPVTAQLRDELGELALATAPLPVTVSVSGASAFGDPACTQPLGAAAIAAGAAGLDLFLSGTVAGAGTVSVAASSLTGDSQPVTVRAGPTAAFAWEAISGPKSQGAAFSVRARSVDAHGNLTTELSSATLTASPATPLTCSTGCTGTQASLVDGAFDGLVALEAQRASVRLVLTAGAISSSSSSFAVQAAPTHPPTALAFASPSRTTTAGACSEALVIELRDASGQAVAATTPVPVALSAAPSGAASFFADAACTTAASLSFAAGQSQRTFFFSGVTARSFDATVSASGLTSATQTQQLEAAEPMSFSWLPTPTSVRQGADFPVTVQALDAFGNLAAGFTGTADLSVTPSSALLCSAGCSAPAVTFAFQGGVWSGALRLGTPTGLDRLVSASSGPLTGRSNPIDVVDPPGTPPLARLTRSPAVVTVGSPVQFDASGSTDTESSSSALRFSFDPTGAETFPAPWGAWSSTATFTHSYGAPGLYRARVAVKDGNEDVGSAVVDVLVVDATTDLCVVTDSDGSDEGPTSCSASNLSLVEAVRISNATAGRQAITFAPGLAMSFGNTLVVTDGVDIVAPEGVSGAGMVWEFRSGAVLLSSLSFSASSKPFAAVEGGSVRLSGLRLSGYSNLKQDGGSLTVERVRWDDCGSTCFVVDVGAGAFALRDSFIEAVNVNGINIHDCSGPLREVRSTVFRRVNKGVHVKNNCGTGGVRIVHNTFDSVQSGAQIDSGLGHVLVNNVFTHNDSGPIQSCGASFAQRSHSLIFASDFDGCTETDPGTVLADPLYVGAAAEDFRLRPDSPARDSGLTLGDDLTPWAPGDFLGLAPDRGARETW